MVEGPLFRVHDGREGIEVLRSPADLSERLPAYDLVFTHFGNTAFEALAAGVPGHPVQPQPIPRQPGRRRRLPAGGNRDSPIRGRSEARSAGQAALRAWWTASTRASGRTAPNRLATLLASLQAPGSSSLSRVRLAGNSVMARFTDRTYRRCRRCGIVYLESFAARAEEIRDAYFSSEYRAQYGRTYLEDFEAIKAASRPRVRLVRELTAEGADGVVVDIGCAYGPFLAALKEHGVPGYGVDVSPAAVAYVRKKLGIPALCASFEEVASAALPRRIAAVTLWYVIEHFPDTDLVLRKASSLLPPGGVLAFSTPNGRGISARRECAEFLCNSPADHFTVFSPRGLGASSRAYGLALRRIRVTGHHPERFPGVIGRAARRVALCLPPCRSGERAPAPGRHVRGVRGEGRQ